MKENFACNGRHIKEINALYNIARILSEGDGNSKLVRVLEVLESRLDMYRTTLLLLSLDGSELVFEATASSKTSNEKTVKYSKGEGVVGKVLQTGMVQIIPNIKMEPSFRNRIHERDNTEGWSFICVPVTIENEVIGVITADIPVDNDSSLSENARILSVTASLIAYDVKMHRISTLEKEELERENIHLRYQLKNMRPENMIGNSDKMGTVYEKIAQVAVSDTTVLIRGESGTGKELVASAIHYSSNRADNKFIKVNCAALNENLLESELFGHEKGAFTGANNTRIGRIEEAEGGTLFLDEIGDFTQSIQVKILRLLQEKEYSRVGSNDTKKANVRFIAATNRDLEKAVKDETFRLDLYYRINVFPIFLPPLRERREDILNIANHFLEIQSERQHKKIDRMSTTAIDMLMSYHWPGNVRELENCIEHAVLVCNGNTMQGSHLPPTLRMPEESQITAHGTMVSRVEQLERDMLTDSLKRSRGNVSAAARELGITSRMARYKIKKLGIIEKKFQT